MTKKELRASSFFTLFLLSVCSNAVYAASILQSSDCASTGDSDSKPLKVERIEIESQDIFDEKKPDTGLLHRLANRLHVTTKSDVIAERLPFTKGETITVEQLAEAERIIRKEQYIRDARVTYVDGCNVDEVATVQVETWDNWSMLPSVSFGRKGGKNRFELGFKEDNLLGRGIQTSIEYKTDEQRTGYRFVLRSPLSVIRHSNVVLDVEDNDDGNIVQLKFEKPFYQLSSQQRMLANYLTFKRVDEIFQNGQTQRLFGHEGHQYDLAYGFLTAYSYDSLHRFTFGITDQEDLFSDADTNETPGFISGLPQDRQFVYPWVEYEFLQSDFQVLQDIYLTNQNEDINLGWASKIRIGYETQSTESSFGLHVLGDVSKGYMWDSSLLMLGVNLTGNVGVDNNDLFSMSLHAEYFNRLNTKFAFYVSGLLSASNNQYVDLPVALGGESGVRGYPLQYQHGDNRAVGIAELRYYPQINLYRLFDLGMVAFFDAGKAWSGESASYNETKGVLASTGIGARIYSNRSSHRNVIHVDIALPLQSGEHVDSWQWRLQVKQSF